MASNFDFLPEEDDWCKDVRRAERRIYSDPASACAKARRALEFIVGEVYERELDADDQGDLFADVDARPFQRWMKGQDPDLYDAFHQIRVSGNQGAHHQKEGDVKPTEALNTVRSLKQVVWWYVQRYAPAHAANGDPSFKPPSPETLRSNSTGQTPTSNRNRDSEKRNETDRSAKSNSKKESSAATPSGPSDPPEREGISRERARETKVRTLETASIRKLAQVVKNESSNARKVEVATAILLNRIRDVNDELIATLC